MVRPPGRRFEQRYTKSSTSGALWDTFPAGPAVPAVLSVTATLGAAIELREALVELGRWSPVALSPGLDLANAELLVASELGQRDTRRRHVLVRTDLAVAARRAALVGRLAGARLRREADPLRAPVGRLAVVAGPTSFTAIGTTVTGRRLAPAHADVASWARWILQADLGRVAVLLVAALLRPVALRHAVPLEVQDVRFDRAVANALAQLADVSRSAVDERAQVQAHTGRRGLRDARVDDAIIRPSSEALTVVPGRAIAVVQALAWMCFRKDSALNLEVAKRRHHDEALEPRSLSVTDEQALTEVNVVEDRRVEQLEARTERLAEPHHLMRGNREDTDDARNLGTLAFRFEAILPARVDAAHAFAEMLQAFDELVRRREAALSVRLPLAAGLLVALVDRTPFASARDVHTLFDAELTTAARSHAAFSGWLFAVPFMLDANAGAGSLASVDVVASVATADWLEDAWAIAASRSRDAPVGVRL